jgi:prephenate dehydrogenase
VGSTKRQLVERVDDQRFIGGHPIAGAETSGVEHARADLFQGAVWYLTPREHSSGLLYERLHRLIVAFGARPVAIDAESHDRLLATVSHLPHVLANVLVSQAARVLASEDEALPRVGPSFRDATRVAGASTAIWSDIYLSNADALVAAIDDTMARLGDVRAALAGRDTAAVGAWNDAAREDRRRLLEADLAGGEMVELRVSVPNRPGVVADVALALGRASVNIVDMALYPAADNTTGSIALWIAGDDDAREAEGLIAALGFTVARP